MTSLWHPGARRVPIFDVPDLTFVDGSPKMVWHSTEGSTIEGAVSAYRASEAVPHFTIAVLGGHRTLFQHLPLNRAATALQHTYAAETNRANAIQCEIVGFAAHSGNWSESFYHYLNLLAKYVHNHKDIPMSTGVNWRKPQRLGAAEFVRYAGHCGHVHVPGNTHTDPGTGFHIGKVLKK